MSASIARSLAFAAALAGAGLFAMRADAEQNSVTFPVIEDLTHYTTVERGVTVEHMLTTDEALAAIQAGTEGGAAGHRTFNNKQINALRGRRNLDAKAGNVEVPDDDIARSFGFVQSDYGENGRVIASTTSSLI